MNTPGNMTEMQYRLAHAKHIRDNLLQVACQDTPFYLPGSKRLMQGIMRDMLIAWSEAEIKRFLFELLQCYDLTEEQRKEALYILEASTTALTREQKQTLKSILYD